LLLSTYVPDFRVELRDSVRKATEEFFGNGLINLWELNENNIVVDSIVISIDGILLLSTEYTVDYSLGFITFDSAPADETIVTIMYQYTRYTDNLLAYCLKRSIDTIEGIYSVGYATSGSGITLGVSPEPTGEMLGLWYSLGTYYAKYDDLLLDANTYQNWRDGDVSVTEMANLQMRKGLLDGLWERILFDLERLILDNATGGIKSGGSDPLPYGAGVTSTGPTEEDFLWPDGIIGDI